LAKSDDNIDWDRHWSEHEEDMDFYDTGVFDYFRDLLPKDFKVLDIGCGSCKFYPAFKSLGCAEYVGVDFSSVAIDLAKKKFPHLRLFFMRVEEINFDSYFDLVFSNTFLQHTLIETKRKIFPKVWKSLKPNGLLVIQEKSDVDTLTTFTRENWIKFIEPFGFKFIKGTPEGDPRNGFVFRVIK
jgi:SAM-dependent methyltransferase